MCICKTSNLGEGGVYRDLRSVSRVILYTVDHTIGLLRVSHTTHVLTLFTIISIVITILFTSMDIVKGCNVVIILH